MPRRQKEDRFDRLLKVAQVFNLLNNPVQQQAQLAQQGESDRVRAAIALLGLRQSGDLAREDRVARTGEAAAGREHLSKESALDRLFRGDQAKTQQEFAAAEGEKGRVFTRGENEANRKQSGEQFVQSLAETKAGCLQQGEIANRGLANAERQTTNQETQFGTKHLLDQEVFRHTKSVDEQKMEQALRQIMLQENVAGADKQYKQSDLDLRRAALDAQTEGSERGQLLDFYRGLVGQPGIDMNQVMAGSGIKGVQEIGQNNLKDAMSKAVDAHSQVLNNVTSAKSYKTVLDSIPGNIQANLDYATGNRNFNPSLLDFLPAGWQGQGDANAALQAAGVPTDTSGNQFGIPSFPSIKPQSQPYKETGVFGVAPWLRR